MTSFIAGVLPNKENPLGNIVGGSGRIANAAQAENEDQFDLPVIAIGTRFRPTDDYKGPATARLYVFGQ